MEIDLKSIASTNEVFVWPTWTLEISAESENFPTIKEMASVGGRIRMLRTGKVMEFEIVSMAYREDGGITLELNEVVLS